MQGAKQPLQMTFGKVGPPGLEAVQVDCQVRPYCPFGLPVPRRHGFDVSIQ